MKTLTLLMIILLLFSCSITTYDSLSEDKEEIIIKYRI